MLRLLAAECRILPHRIRVGLKMRVEIRDLPMLPEELAAEQRRFCGPRNYRHAYIRDMQRLLAEYPQLTRFDLYLAGRTWSYGTHWNDHNSRTEQNQETSS